MSEFLRSLRSFGVGSLSSEQLLAEVDRHLAQCLTDPVTMLAWLDEEHARSALPRELHDAISERILGSLGVPATGGSRATSAEAPEFFRDSEASATLLNDPAEPMLEFSSAPAMPGKVLKHRFKLVACVGEGGMGRVYRAIDLRRLEARARDVYVAVKVLTKSCSDHARSLSLLQREAARLQRLSHPNIVRVIDCDRDGQMVFMTMEYLSGQPLKRKLGSPDAPGMTREQSIHVLECIADALSFAHRNDIVHGDLKPGNVIVTDAGEVKVIDFGIARAMARSGVNPECGSDEELDRLGALTPSYASPEMLERKPPDARDDVYALACITYEMLTGAHPFERKAATDARVAGLKLVRRHPLSRTQFKALLHALRFDREARTPSVERFMQEFRGDRAHSTRRVALAAVVAVVAIAAGAYLLNRARMHSAVAALTAGEVFRDCQACPLMKVLPIGRFEQGSTRADSRAEPFELPRHAVTIGYPFSLGVHEVTKGEFQQFVEATGREMAGCASYDDDWVTRSDLSWGNVGFAQSASHPVVCVSWRDANAYADWLSGKTGERYRLPSASEWEYAARAGSDGEQPWAANAAEACTSANVADEAAAERYAGWNAYACNDGYVYTAPAGTFAANAFGLKDMLGNAFEWVQDCWHDDYVNAPTDGSAWLEGECKDRELRGGSWFTMPAFVRAAYRNRFEEAYRSNSVGFRVVRELRR